MLTAMIWDTTRLISWCPACRKKAVSYSGRLTLIVPFLPHPPSSLSSSVKTGVRHSQKWRDVVGGSMANQISSGHICSWRLFISL